MKIIRLTEASKSPFYADVDAVEFVGSYLNGCVSIRGVIYYPAVQFSDLVAIIKREADSNHVRLVDISSDGGGLYMNAVLFSGAWEERDRTCIGVGSGCTYTTLPAAEVARRAEEVMAS